MTLRSGTKSLLALALALPVVQSVLIWVRGMLSSMGDDAGAAIIGHVGTACLVVWSVTLVGLLMLLALIAVNAPRLNKDEE